MEPLEGKGGERAAPFILQLHVSVIVDRDTESALSVVLCIDTRPVRERDPRAVDIPPVSMCHGLYLLPWLLTRRTTVRR